LDIALAISIRTAIHANLFLQSVQSDERQACEIWQAPERRAERLLQQMERAKGGNHPKTCVIYAATLADIFLYPNQEVAEVADVPADHLEFALQGERPNTTGIIAS
jgi:hypothetical protein